MIVKLIIFICLLFITSTAEAVTVIDSFPFSANSAGVTYVMTSNLTLDTGTAITIGANNVVIDCQGRVINFAQAAEADGIGINVAGYDNIEIKNCVFNTINTTGDAFYVIHVYLGATGSAGTVNIHHNTFNILGRTTDGTYTDRDWGIRGTTATSGTVKYNNFNMTGMDRMTGIRTEGGPWDISNNIFRAHDCTCTNAVSPAYPFFVRIMGGTVIIQDNIFTVENTCTLFYPINSWDTNSAQVLRNLFTFSAAHGRIINPDNASASWIIRDNTMQVTNTGAAFGAGFQNVYGIRYRNANAEGGDCGGLHTIEYNTVDCSGYTGAGSCNSISIGGYGDATNACYGTHIRYNYFKGLTYPFQFYTDTALNVTDQEIYCNKIEATSGSTIVFGSDTVSDIHFSHNLLTASNGNEVSTASNLTDEAYFCENGTITVAGGGSVSAEAAPCPNGYAECYLRAGVRVRDTSTGVAMTGGTR